jgi:hypothetical protein
MDLSDSVSGALIYYRCICSNFSKDQIYSSEVTNTKALQLFYIVITKVSPQLQGKRESTHAFSFNANREPRRLLFQAPTGVPSHYAHVSFAPLFKPGISEKTAKPFAFSISSKMQYGQNNKKYNLCRLVRIKSC